VKIAAHGSAEPPEQEKERMADELERRLLAAYASGDADAIVAAMSGGIVDDSVSALSTATASLDVSARPRSPTCMDGGDKSENEENATECDTGEEDRALSALAAAYPHADMSIIQAILYAHAGDIEASGSSLSELDGVGALNGRSETGDPRASSTSKIDTKAYAAAVSHWDNDFPALGGSTPRSTKQASTYEGGKLLASVRERHLIESLPWIPPNVVSADFRLTGNPDSTRVRLSRSHPKPSDWDQRQAKAVDNAIREALQKSSSSWRDDGYDDDIGVSGPGESHRWVKSGASVARRYASCRERATAEARHRNKYFELASVKARTGNGAEAARLGGLGRAANSRMKALHAEAADLLWEENNSDYVREGQLDLHGLHVAEAVERLPGALEAAANTGRKTLQVVFGTGHHSKPGGGAPRLRPAVTAFLRDAGYSHREVKDTKTRLVSAVLVDLR
jgi:DNA-nicking Smr family endonuclease